MELRSPVLGSLLIALCMLASLPARSSAFGRAQLRRLQATVQALDDPVASAALLQLKTTHVLEIDGPEWTSGSIGPEVVADLECRASAVGGEPGKQAFALLKAKGVFDQGHPGAPSSSRQVESAVSGYRLAMSNCSYGLNLARMALNDPRRGSLEHALTALRTADRATETARNSLQTLAGCQEQGPLAADLAANLRELSRLRNDVEARMRWH